MPSTPYVGRCVPDGIWRDMVEARGGDNAYVSANVHRVWDNLGGQTVPLDRFKFWRTQWDMDHPTRAPAKAAKVPYRSHADWVCPHAPHCGGRRACQTRRQLDREKAQAVGA